MYLLQGKGLGHNAVSATDWPEYCSSLATYHGGIASHPERVQYPPSTETQASARSLQKFPCPDGLKCSGH